MSQIETEAPPAYSPYRGDDTAGQAGGVSDISNLTDSIDTTITLARDTYRSCIKYLEAFDLVAHDVAALFALLEVIGESVEDHGVNHAMVESATKLLSASKDSVSNLQTLVTKYEDLPVTSKRVWLRTMGGAEELVGLRGQLRKNIDSSSALNKNITSSSPKGVLEMVQKFMSEIRTGQRKESIVSRSTSLNVGDATTRIQIQQELEDVGITSLLFNQFHVLILQTLITERDLPQQAVAKAPPKESRVTKALQNLKINRNPSGKSHSPGPSNPPTAGTEKSSPSGPSKTPTPVTTQSGTPPGTMNDLITAISHDDLSLVEQFLDRSFDINSRDESGRTPLMVAVGYDKVDIAELLLLRGIDVNAKTFHSEETALISACASGRDKIIMLILELGKPALDLDARDRNGRTALMRASAQGYDREVKLLVKAGADLEAKDKNGRTALNEASRFGHDQNARLLIKLGAKRW
ncbi:hypothetical protein V501_09605 [Pseudogymnoascus sp. VKM F-4519 (FW-2642)]|nr:hypothetical protein V501_09605 [Pseudogymnoascus sp. VKM F-4519 (FW-2642)]